MQWLAGALDSVVSLLTLLRDYGLWFLVFLTILVFVHELGHYLVARRNGVRVEVFSIGFGPELFGWYDRAGTRWKVSAIPLGGYVKMFGDAGASSMPGAELAAMSAEERAVCFHHKRLGQRVAIVAAGPIANFLFAIALLSGLFAIVGQPFTAPEVDSIQPGSAAEMAGLRAGDVFIRIDGEAIQRFEEIQRIVQASPGKALDVVIRRDGGESALTLTPRASELTDRLGHKRQIGVIGIRNTKMQVVRHDPLTALWQASRETFGISVATLKAVGEMIAGTRTTEELGGPLRIAQMSGEVGRSTIESKIWFIAVLSINLGLINLFPIPVLDGGHLLLYAAEALRGRPLGPKALEYTSAVGLALVLALMIFATWNDLVHLKVVDFFGSLLG
jgi:regulator of sigma E protease